MQFNASSSSTPSLVAPAPWTLTGDGIILLYHFSESWVLQQGFLAPYQQDSYRGWVGSVMLVDYHTTPVGPYRELLFIPGLFHLQNRLTFSISKIFVSTYESVWNGIQNWGIPKERCDFSLRHQQRTTHFEASLQGQPFFEATCQRSTWSLPITTGFMPLRITQRLNDDLVFTAPHAKGKAYWGKLKQLKINPVFFPDLSTQRPLATIVVKDFQMTFPVATFHKSF